MYYHLHSTTSWKCPIIAAVQAVKGNDYLQISRTYAPSIHSWKLYAWWPSACLTWICHLVPPDWAVGEAIQRIVNKWEAFLIEDFVQVIQKQHQSFLKKKKKFRQHCGLSLLNTTHPDLMPCWALSSPRLSISGAVIGVSVRSTALHISDYLLLRLGTLKTLPSLIM